MELHIEVEEARRRWSYLVHQVTTYGVRVVLLHNGRIVGALVGREDLEFLQRHGRAAGALDLSTGPPSLN